MEELIRQAFVVVGFPAGEASDMAHGIERVVASGLSASNCGQQIRLRLLRDGSRFHVDVGAEHLPAAPSNVALIDQVSVRREGARTTHRFTRELPRS